MQVVPFRANSVGGLLRHLVSREDGGVNGSALDRHALLAMTVGLKFCHGSPLYARDAEKYEGLPLSRC